MTSSFNVRELSNSTIELDLGILAQAAASFDFSIFLETSERFKDPEGWSNEPYYFKPLSVSSDTTTKLAITRGIAWGIPFAAPVRIDVPGLGHSAHGQWPIAINGTSHNSTSRTPVDPVKLIIEELTRASQQSFASPANQAATIPVVAPPVVLAAPASPAIATGLTPKRPVPGKVPSKLLFAVTILSVGIAAGLIRQVHSIRQDAETLANSVKAAQDELQNEQKAHVASQASLMDAQRELSIQRTLALLLPQAERERDAARLDVQSQKLELRSERDAHVTTKDKLSALEQQIDSERALRNSSTVRQDAEALGKSAKAALDDLRKEQTAHLASKALLTDAKRELDTERARAQRLPQAERERDAARSESQADKAQLADAKRELDTQRALALRMPQIERERDAALSDAQAERSARIRERDSHAVTRERLAGVEQQLDSERARNARPAPPALASVMPEIAADAPTDRAPLSECDTLAANPTDPRRIGIGVPFPILRNNARAAIDACDRALAANPNDLRLRYQRARALHAANDGRAAAIFHELVRAEYPAAFDNAGQLLVNEKKLRDAETVYRNGVRLGDPDSMVALADLIRVGKVTARVFGEDQMLYQGAASLGHKGAQNDVQNRRAAGQMMEFGLDIAKKLMSR